MIVEMPYFLEPLPLNSSPNKIRAFDVIPNFTISTKNFDTAGGKIVQRTNAEHTNHGINIDQNKRLNWLYESEIKYIILNLLQKSHPNGLGTLSNSDMDTIAAHIAGMSGEYIVSDYEPHNPDADGWIWTSYNNPAKINYISQKVKELTLSGGNFKKFMDWFQLKTFSFGGKTLSIQTNNWVFEWAGSTVDDYINCHANPSGASNFADDSSIAYTGWGYTSITLKIDNAGGSPYDANVNYGAIPSYLKSLDAVALMASLRPAEEVLYIVWPREDQERISYECRFKVSDTTQGYLRLLDNRLGYPTQLVSANIMIAASFKNVKKLTAWIMPTSENPLDMLRYAKRNGQHFCQSSVLGFDLAEYTGPDYASIPCPTSNIDFMNPSEAKGMNSILSALYSVSLHEDILDGTQVASFPAFRWKYDGGNWNDVDAVSDLSGFARSWKYKRPFFLVQTNQSGDKVALFQNPFTRAFKRIRFECSSLGIDSYTEGNYLKTVKIFA